jgi:hypothetical protein
MRWIVTWGSRVICRLVAISALFVLSLGATPAAGYGIQALEKNWNICARQTQKREHEQRIPHRLLRAISLAEAGRWHPDTREISAWPWTVMAQGKGRFFETKQAALAWVRNLQAKGITNIDVGCMQVNLFHHGHQFPSLEHAMDPEHNTAYAAKFLRKKYTAARSWAVAAGHYHSTNPIKNTPYRRKVLKFWHGTSHQQKPQVMAKVMAEANQTKTASQEATPKRLSSPDLKLRLRRIKPEPFSIDSKRMKMLNTNFRQTLAGTPPAIQPKQEGGAHVQEQAQEQPPKNAPPTRFKSKRTLKKIIRRHGNGKLNNFAERRRTQLQQWRRTKAWRAHRVDG